MSDNVNHPAHHAQWPIEVICLTERELFLTARQEDTTEMRVYLQDQLTAVYNRAEKELCEAWDAT